MLEVATCAVYTKLGSIITVYYYLARPCYIAFLNCPQSFCDCVISINIVFASNYSSRGALLHIVKDKQSVEEVKKKKKNKKNCNILSFPVVAHTGSIVLYVLSIFKHLQYNWIFHTS